MSERRLLVPGYRQLLHGGDYNPDQWLKWPEVIDEDFRLMKLAGCNFFSIGIFAWTSYEPEEGRYDFGWLDRIMDRMAEASSKVALATPSGAKPAWMSNLYPEIRRVNREGRREPHGWRHNHCWSSAIYRNKVKAINGALAKRYHGHPALGVWHISNEYGGECFCSLCLTAWRSWLEEKYGAIEVLNEAWWTGFWSHTFTSFEQIDPRDTSMDGLSLDFRRFTTQQIVDFLKWEIASVREYSPDVPCTTNMIGLIPWVDYSKVAEVVDFIADDQYPGYADDAKLERRAFEVSFKDDLYRSFKPDRPWMLMESCPDAPQWRHPTRLKRPGLHEAEMLQALGHGAEGTCYFQWRKGRGGSEKLHGAVVDHAGHENTRVFRAVANVGAAFQRLEPIIGSVVKSEVAMLYDWEVRWALETSDGVRNKNDAYFAGSVDHYEPFARRAISVDVLASERDFSGYKLVIAPQLWMLKPGVAERIARYVEAGGCFVATHYTGIVDETNRCFLGGFPGQGLIEVFGVWNEETDWLGETATRRVVVNELGASFGLADHYEARQVCALVELRGAAPLAHYDEDFYAASPAFTLNHFGSGSAYYQAAWLGSAFFDDFYGALADKLSIDRAVRSKLPPSVFVQRRIKQGQEFLFLENFSPTPREVDLRRGGFVDLLKNEPVADCINLDPWASTVLSG